MMKKIPMRTCIACKEKQPKKDLIRIVYSETEGLTYDLTGKKNGRGAYICRSLQCVDKLKKETLQSALKQPIGSEAFDQLMAALHKEIQPM
ncbi:RNase P modulator RnpM [Pseudoramibacter faecis]|uniref:RNase P modulator RnpM n=1 Tax=Pseudoramibacter faecis TaxID=3108534 RepID=UPI002E777F19|nr:YlxR family protein [Pseudoramibacter sp. HA2172]